MKGKIELTVNGKPYEIENVPPYMTLVELLRDRLSLKGTKMGCGVGDCGSCIVIMDGRSVNSCLVLALETDGSDIWTIEGIGQGNRLHPLQEAFIETGAIQCGFCTPGMIMSAKELLDRKPHPTREEIKRAISGNLCRCTGYQKIIEAIEKCSKT